MNTEEKNFLTRNFNNQLWQRFFNHEFHELGEEHLNGLNYFSISFNLISRATSGDLTNLNG